MAGEIVTKEEMTDCRLESDKRFDALTTNLNNYHKKMDNYIDRTVGATNGKHVERRPDDLVAEIWETILILRDMKNFIAIVKRWKKLFIGIGLFLLIFLGKWQISDFITWLVKYHFIK